MNKKLSLLEKERKDKEREELKKRKEMQKQEDAKRRESLRHQQQEALKKERAQGSKSGKESAKLRQQIRRDVNNDIRKNRADASSAVLQYYDYEELEELASSGLGLVQPTNQSPSLVQTQRQSSGDQNNSQQQQRLLQQENESACPLSSFLSLLPDFTIRNKQGEEGGGTAREESAKEVEKTILLSTTLNLLHNHLNLETSSKLDNILSCLQNIYPSSDPHSEEAPDDEVLDREGAEDELVKYEDNAAEVAEAKENEMDGTFKTLFYANYSHWEPILIA